MKKKIKLIPALVLLPVVQSVFADNSQCSAKIQLTHFTPSICSIDYDESICRDTCAAAVPQGNPACFADIDVPCDIKFNLYETALNYQSLNGEQWVHVSDLFHFPDLKSEYHILNLDAYAAIYENFLALPQRKGFSSSTQEIKKQNFRLSTIDDTKNAALPLKMSAIFNRYSLGLAIEDDVAIDFNNIVKSVTQYPLYSSVERQSLLSELNRIFSSDLFFWQLIKMAPLESVKDARLKFINSKLKSLADKLDLLDENLKEKYLKKANKVLGIHFEPCDIGICNTTVDDMNTAHFYGKLDQRWSHLEVYLDYLINEATTLASAVDEDLYNLPTEPIKQHNFSNVLDSAVKAYVRNPGLDSLRRMESIINVAFLQRDRHGDKFLAAFEETAAAVIDGESFLSRMEGKNPVLCRALDKLDAELKGIEARSRTLAEESRNVFDRVLEEGHTPELVQRLADIANEMIMLANRHQSLSTINRFDIDRKTEVVWHLGSSFDHLKEQQSRLRVEYISIDGMYWSSSMGIPISTLLPTLADISTSSGTLMPSGNGNLVGLNSLKVTLQQSPYTACSESNREITVVVSVEDAPDQRRRYVLTETFDQL